MSKIILKNGTSLNLETFSSLSNAVVKFDSVYDFDNVWPSQFAPENLEGVKVINDNEIVIATYDALVLESVTIRGLDNLTVSFDFREKSDIELRLDAVEASQEDQDEAIEELADIVAGEEE